MWDRHSSLRCASSDQNDQAESRLPFSFLLFLLWIIWTLRGHQPTLRPDWCWDQSSLVFPALRVPRMGSFERRSCWAERQGSAVLVSPGFASRKVDPNYCSLFGETATTNSAKRVRGMDRWHPILPASSAIFVKEYTAFARPSIQHHVRRSTPYFMPACPYQSRGHVVAMSLPALALTFPTALASQTAETITNCQSPTQPKDVKSTTLQRT
ncbi:uncharacterized protein LY79DRAFT_230487 [Colletotrichum navitas]|uniref:Uncharacterized protein n=1 Tax=Colletotrichum navitas TaxID=681940 RepID=A0AAD8V2I6_9PEZI|nr:uncharacterized protein LY79DRAFT_230487 [Colletotrichum navitas]KAK1589875.1 hypothetical protein LY79DRAFT_230487 [Colletotrichum navitas]